MAEIPACLADNNILNIMNLKNIKIKLTIIIDNYVNTAGLVGEHGWSLMIENGNERILFDTGADNLLLKNLKYLGFIPSMINKIFISHGHFDHTGGLFEISKSSGKEIEVFAHEDIFDKKYKSKKGIKNTYIGIPYDREKYIENGIRFRLGKGPIKISDNIYTTGEILSSISFEKPDRNFIKKKNNSYMVDDLIDDTGMIIETARGNILITGCAHRGIINIIKQAQRLSGKDEFLAVIGGFHLSNKSEGYIKKVVCKLRKIKIDKIIPSHCTGPEGYFAIKKVFGKKCDFGYTGKEIIL